MIKVEKVPAKEAMKELTMLLIHLSRLTQEKNFFEATDFFAWKGYDFEVLNQLDDADYIRQGARPSRSKSVYITDAGIELAQELLEKYGIEDWKKQN